MQNRVVPFPFVMTSRLLESKRHLHWWTSIFVQQVFSKMFLLINAPSENNLGTNVTSFESPIKGLLKARSKLGMAPSYGLPRSLE